MEKKKVLNILQIGLSIIYLVMSFISIMTINYYHMFAHLDKYSIIMCIFQWLKITVMFVLPVGILMKKESWKSIIQWILPFIGIGLLFLSNEYLNVYRLNEVPQQEIYDKINLFLNNSTIKTFYIIEAIIILIISCLSWIENPKRKLTINIFIKYLIIFFALTPLNIFDNIVRLFPDYIYNFLKFKNFTIWHLLAIVLLFGSVYVSYNLLKNKTRDKQEYYLQLLAIITLIHYNSKMSIVIGDGYNVYYTIFACIPLFICNIGEFVSAISVFIKKRVTYDIAFFVHAVGALSVFVYFGRDEMSNYGTIISFSFLFFMISHLLLFNLCVLPSLLGHYKFELKNCKIPLIYYGVVMIIATIASTLVTNYSATLMDSNGNYLQELLYPNYAFTQINPLPVDVPELIVINTPAFKVNVLYVVLAYGFYILLFFVFYFVQKGLVNLYNIIKEKKNS